MEADGQGQEMLEEVDHGSLRMWELGTSHRSQVFQKYSAIPHTMAKGRQLLSLKYILHLIHPFQEFVIAFNQTLLDVESWLRMCF